MELIHRSSPYKEASTVPNWISRNILLRAPERRKMGIKLE
jgi:hypothetical protein